MLIYLYLVFICSKSYSLIPASFYGQMYLYTSKGNENTKFEMDLKFYKLSRDQLKSNKYILIYINNTDESILDIQNQNDFLYVFGNINIEDSQSIKFKKKFIPVLGVYETKHKRLFLAHSLNKFFREETIRNYVINTNNIKIEYKHDLFSFLFKIKRILNEIKIKEPLSKDNSNAKIQFIDQIQLTAMKVYSYEISFFPLIYLKVEPSDNQKYNDFFSYAFHLMQNKKSKYSIDVDVEGYLDADNSFFLSKKYGIVNLFEIRTTQFKKYSFNEKTRTHNIVFGIICITYCVIYLISGFNMTFTSYFEFLPAVLYDFIYCIKRKRFSFRINDEKIAI